MRVPLRLSALLENAPAPHRWSIYDIGEPAPGRFRYWLVNPTNNGRNVEYGTSEQVGNAKLIATFPEGNYRTALVARNKLEREHRFKASGAYDAFKKEFGDDYEYQNGRTPVKLPT